MPRDIEIQGEGDLGKGGRTEDDETDAVAFPPGQEVIEDLLHRIEPVDLFAPAVCEILRLHGSGQVDQQQYVAGRQGLRQGRFEQLGTCERQNEQAPEQHQQDCLPTPQCRHTGSFSRLLPGESRDAFKPGEAYGLALFTPCWQQRTQEQW